MIVNVTPTGEFAIYYAESIRVIDLDSFVPTIFGIDDDDVYYVKDDSVYCTSPPYVESRKINDSQINQDKGYFSDGKFINDVLPSNNVIKYYKNQEYNITAPSTIVKVCFISDLILVHYLLNNVVYCKVIQQDENTIINIEHVEPGKDDTVEIDNMYYSLRLINISRDSDTCIYHDLDIGMTCAYHIPTGRTVYIPIICDNIVFYVNHCTIVHGIETRVYSLNEFINHKKYITLENHPTFALEPLWRKQVKSARKI